MSDVRSFLQCKQYCIRTMSCPAKFLIAKGSDKAIRLCYKESLNSCSFQRHVSLPERKCPPRSFLFHLIPGTPFPQEFSWGNILVFIRVMNSPCLELDHLISISKSKNAFLNFSSLYLTSGIEVEKHLHDFPLRYKWVCEKTVHAESGAFALERDPALKLQIHCLQNCSRYLILIWTVTNHLKHSGLQWHQYIFL